MAKRKSDRNTDDTSFVSNAGQLAFIRRHSVTQRHKVLENTILFLTQALLAVDFQQSMRKGAVWRLEVDMQMMMFCFHGCGKTNYAQLLLMHEFV